MLKGFFKATFQPELSWWDMTGILLVGSALIERGYLFTTIPVMFVWCIVGSFIWDRIK